MHFPGKCQSHTSSTYTFTTCRIMHPSDELTRVTPSVMSGPTASCVLTSSLLRCSSTPASSPCTPRRLSVAESFTNLRDSTKTTSTSLGLVCMLQDRGISAAVYDPRSWDRAASDPAGHAHNPAERAVGQDSRRGTDTLPSTPPNSPTRAKRCSPVAAPPFDYSPSAPPYDNFLASKPASSILKEVRQAEAAQQQQHADTESQTDASVHNLRLLDKVKRLGVSPRPLTLGPFCGGLRRPGGAAHPMVTSPIGGLPTLNAGMRRNRSYPAMVGASMAMKGLGPESGTELLLPTPLPKQTSLNQE